jgi:hypothetical protein
MERRQARTSSPVPAEKNPKRAQIAIPSSDSSDQDGPSDLDLEDATLTELIREDRRRDKVTDKPKDNNPQITSLIDAFEIPPASSSSNDRKLFALTLKASLLAPITGTKNKIEIESNLRTIDVLLDGDLTFHSRHAIALLVARCQEVQLVESRSPQYATSWSRTVTAASKGSDLLAKAHRAGALAEAHAPKPKAKQQHTHKGKARNHKKPSDAPKKD